MDKPFRFEQIYDTEFQQLIADICRHPGMYISPITFDSACSYICGFDAARDGAPLIGLEPWLITQLKSGTNLSWVGLVRIRLQKTISLDDEKQAITSLGQLLDEFFNYRRTKGLTKIFYDFAKFLRRQRWYTGPLR